ncbi:DUF6080 domain-containing protein [Elizabethkingia sp. JS20170427COW]|uniref:DUF6080 domain-containing protein n=1 Tax=Elizabethkingia sp. JS20170427COW TaxID=2583851 RepID=UPI0011101B5F|nr:DUF6080 domain-containing protein [Elizabethkingia sp. JS20170427COW]QCX53110.1 hypothetical protein FGE20_04885 [Elizabethkingia sp. JS20170427COW]
MKSALHQFIKILFPSSKIELGILLFFFIAYGSLGYYLADQFRIIYDERVPWDAYFSFDNVSIVKTGGGWERHPFSIYLFDGIRNTALWLSHGKTNAIFRITLVAFSTFTIAMSFVQLFKYLKNIIQLNTRTSLFLLTFFGFFTTPILLSFTPETYTYSLFLLIFFNYYAALKIQQGKSIGVIPLSVFGVFIGGLTITNVVKTYIPILYEKKLFKSWKQFGKATIKVLVSIGVFIFLYLWKLGFKYEQIINQTSTQYEKFSNPKVTPLWDMMTSWFWGGNMLFSSFFTRDYHSKTNFEYKALFMDVYSSAFSYIWVAIVFFLILWALLKNIKNPLVQILGLSFLVDVLIHCVLKFGLHTSYIYGGHFIFVVPMLLGWLFYSQKNNPKTFKGLWITSVLLLVYLALNNLYRLTDFIEFAQLYYR